MSVTSVAAFPGGTPLTGAVGISSGNPYINVSTDVTGGKNNVQLSYVNTGFSAFVTNPATEQITGGLLTFAGAGGTTVAIDNLANTLTITGGGGGGSSITGGGAQVACDDPAGSGSISLTTSALASRGSIVISTAATAAAPVDIRSSGATVVTCSDTAHPAILTVGGDPALATTGLYVSDTQLLFNNVPVGGGGGGGNWSYKGVFNTTADTAYALNDVVFDTLDTSQTYICILAYTTATPYPAPSTDATHWLLLATDSKKWSFRGVWDSTTTYFLNDVVQQTAGLVGAIIFQNQRSGVILPSSNAPWTSAGEADGWNAIAGNGISGFNEGDAATNPDYMSVIQMVPVPGSPPPTSSNGEWIFTVLNGQNNVFTDFCAGRFVVAGVNSGLIPASGNTLPYITTQNPTEGITLEINGGGATAPPVNIIASGLNLNGVPFTGGGTGNVTYTPAVFPWTSGTAYVVGDIVSDKGQTYIAAVDNTAGSGNEPYLAGATTWQSIGGLNANIFGGTWDANAGYGVGTIVNSTSGTAGLYVCIQAVPAVTPPATNPAPSASTTYWTMLNATAVPSGGAMTLNSSPWDVANAYPSQTLLNDYNTWGGFVTTAAVTGGDAPWTSPTPASWQNLTYGYSYFYGSWDSTGATSYPSGSIVTYDGGVYSANVAQVPAVPPTPPALTPPNDPANWSVVVQPAFTPAVLNSVNQSLDSTELVLVQTATGGIVVPIGGITLYNPLSFPGYPATTPAPYTLVPNAVYRISGYIYVSGFAGGDPTVQLGFNLNGNASATGNVYIYNTPGWSGALAPLGQTFDAVFTAPADATVLGGVCILQNTGATALSADFTAILSSKTDTGANAYPVANSLIIQRLS